MVANAVVTLQKWHTRQIGNIAPLQQGVQSQDDYTDAWIMLDAFARLHEAMIDAEYQVLKSLASRE